ncbi:MAG TPA: sulfurtransferase [Rhodospirillaceae bacterium]|nr:sulfurtransferase [Rhodospirillaceae bacterium]HAA91872.1 sulfurtransferase [Rhodospirillaceae bacterium]HAT35837.1 sulfurtransferase [Rhodospirillaceae bacterium]|tara:strand:- start:189 stop:626 length:438 start_codon:yes stop_codon:yes gene_type:complete
MQTKLFNLIAALVFLASGAANAIERNLTLEEAYKALAGGELVLIDVRSPEEWRRTGLAKGALPITMHNPQGKEAFFKAVLARLKGNLDQPIAMICATGIRSLLTQRFLQSKGFKNVANVPAGMFGRKGDPGWIERGLPVVPCPNC